MRVGKMPKRRFRKAKNKKEENKKIMDPTSLNEISEDLPKNLVNRTILQDDTVMRSLNLSDNWWENVPDRSNSRQLGKLQQVDSNDDTRIIRSPFPNWLSYIDYRNAPIKQFSCKRSISRAKLSDVFHNISKQIQLSDIGEKLTGNKEGCAPPAGALHEANQLPKRARKLSWCIQDTNETMLEELPTQSLPIPREDRKFNSSRVHSIRESSGDHHSPVIAQGLKRRLLKRSSLLCKGIPDHSKSHQVVLDTRREGMLLSQYRDSNVKIKGNSMFNMPHNSSDIAQSQENMSIGNSKPNEFRSETRKMSVPRIVSTSLFNTGRESPSSESSTADNDIGTISSYNTTHMSMSKEDKHQEKNVCVENSKNARLRTKPSTSQKFVSKSTKESHDSMDSFDGEHSERVIRFQKQEVIKNDGANLFVLNNEFIDKTSRTILSEESKQKEDEGNISSQTRIKNYMSTTQQKLSTINIGTPQDIKEKKAKRETERVTLIKQYLKSKKTPVRCLQKNFGGPKVTMAECKTETSMNRKRKPSKPDGEIVRNINRAEPHVRRPQWLHARLHKSLMKALITKINGNEIQTQKKAKVIITELVSLIGKVLNYRRKGRNPFVDDIIKHLYRSGVITTPMNFICFCMQYFPEPFIYKALLDRENDSGILGNVINQDLNL